MSLLLFFVKAASFIFLAMDIGVDLTVLTTGLGDIVLRGSFGVILLIPLSIMGKGRFISAVYLPNRSLMLATGALSNLWIMARISLGTFFNEGFLTL